MGQGCKGILRDLRDLFPCRDVFGSHVVGVRKGTPHKGGMAVGLGQIFKTFVSKMENEGMVGRLSLGFLRESRCGSGTFGCTNGEG